MISCLCSAFDRFLELYQLYRQSPPSDPDESYRTPGPTDYLDEDGFIDPNFSLPANFLVANMPELKVGIAELYNLCKCSNWALPWTIPSLNQANPFAERMCEIFMVTDTGNMKFIEFLDMVSTFSPKVRRPVIALQFSYMSRPALWFMIEDHTVNFIAIVSLYSVTWLVTVYMESRSGIPLTSSHILMRHKLFVLSYEI